MHRTVLTLVALQFLLTTGYSWSLTKCPPVKSNSHELIAVSSRALADAPAPASDVGSAGERGRQVQNASRPGVATYVAAPPSFAAPSTSTVHASSSSQLSGSESSVMPSFERNFTAGEFGMSDSGNETDSTGGEDEGLPLNPLRRAEFLRERKKQQMLHVIQSNILERLGLSQTPNISSPNLSDTHRRRMVRMFELMRPHHQVPMQEPDDIYAERVQSFYPLCSLPRNTDKELWSDTGMFHVHYEVPAPRAGSVLTVYTAKLRLFKWSSPLPAADDGTVPALCHDVGAQSDLGEWAGDNGAPRAEERFRISVLQYLRPLRKNKKAKRIKKLVDSRMVAADFEGWLEFNVRTSIKDWLDNPAKNLGLEIVLEDTLGNNHNPAQFFRNMNCSEGRYHQAASSAGVPVSSSSSAGMGYAGDDVTSAAGGATLYENETYPTLDLRTVEMVESTDSATGGKNEIARRRRRAAPNLCDDTAGCCFMPIKLSFQELGWDDWIIAPSNITTGVCMGSCSASDNEIKNECTPISGPQELAILDEEGSITMRTLQDIITVGCRCDAP